MTTNPVSITTAFNARTLNSTEVARTFVPPDAYDVLIRADHTLLVGPRGSGKTTLLKMLQPEALEAWTDPKADSYRDRITFTGVFIPADNAWNAQLHSSFQVDAQHSKAIAFSAFTTHILRALVETMRYRAKSHSANGLKPFRRVHLSEDSEIAFVREIAASWEIETELPTLAGLNHALSGRLAKLGQIRNQMAQEKEIPIVDSWDFLHLDFIASGGNAVRLFNDLIGEPNSKWALLFDELENVPSTMRDTLVSNIRSVDPHFLFKLSLTPYNEELGFESQGAPVVGQDFEYINLTYARKKDSERFARKLFGRELELRGIQDLTPETLLGPSQFDASDEDEQTLEGGKSYRKGSSIHSSFVRLKEQDPTFREYLQDSNIDLDNLDSLDPIRRAAHLRKVRNLVVVREYFRTGIMRKRSRKSIALYAGARSMFAMLEGNPRLLIGVLRGLIDEYAETRAKVSPRRQGEIISIAIDRFLALLHTIPGWTDPRTDKPSGIVGTLETIGEYLSSQVVDAPFSANPPGSFVVDEGAREADVVNLAQALNAGAIVHVPNGSQGRPLRAIRGQKFRLSYLLAPHYKLPLMLGRQVSLSSILKQSKEDDNAPPLPNLFEQ